MAGIRVLFIQLSRQPFLKTTIIYDSSIFTPRAKLNLRRKNVFPIRITEPWNSLPDTVVTAKSLNSFKTRLDKFWYNRDIVYDFEAPLRITNN